MMREDNRRTIINHIDINDQDISFVYDNVLTKLAIE
jgi:hypothetical protein